MKTAFSRRIRRLPPLFLVIGFAVVAAGIGRAADTDRKIPVTRDRGGNEVSVVIAPDGDRQTATPSARLAGPTADRTVEQIEKRTGIDLGHSDPIKKLSRESGKSDGELTARDAKDLLRALRDSMRRKQHATAQEGGDPAAGKN